MNLFIMHFTFHLGMLLSARIFSEDVTLKIKIYAMIISHMHITLPHLHARQFLFVESHMWRHYIILTNDYKQIRIIFYKIN